MSDVISDYQKWKEQGERLRAQARQAMEARFRELLGEAVRLAEEYRHDFGGLLKPPAGITAFRYKSSGRAKKAARTAPAAKAAKPPARVDPPSKPDKPSRKVVGMQKRLAAARKKLDDAKAAGAPTRVLEDRIYEIEDELRLAAQ